MRERDLVGRAGRFIVEGEVTLRVMLSPRGARSGLESVLLAPERVAGPGGGPGRACPNAPPVYTAPKRRDERDRGVPDPSRRPGGRLARRRSRAPEALMPPAPAGALVVGLVGLTNHDNVGGLFRNAAAFGADAVLLDAGTCDPLYRKAIRVSAGAALTVPFARTRRRGRDPGLRRSATTSCPWR